MRKSARAVRSIHALVAPVFWLAFSMIDSISGDSRIDDALPRWVGLLRVIFIPYWPSASQDMDLRSAP